MTKSYAIKECLGAIPLEVVASGLTTAEAEASAKRKLQDAHGGLWAGEFRNCHIGSKKWLEGRFPAWAVGAAIDNYEAGLQGYL